MKFFDPNGDGDVTYDEFKNSIGHLLAPGMNPPHVPNCSQPNLTKDSFYKPRSNDACLAIAAQDSLGVSLSLQPHFKGKRPEGRSKDFTKLDAPWNNKYFQALDVNGTGTEHWIWSACERGTRADRTPNWN
jgi:hypothetical protein